MERILDLVLLNSIGAAALAVATAGLALRWKNPQVAHALWLLVLVKLVVPSALEVRLLPGAELAAPHPNAIRATEPAGPGAAVPAVAVASEVRAGPGAGARATTPAVFRVRDALIAAAAAGALLILSVAGWRTFRFRRLVTRQSRGDEAARVLRVGRALGLDHAPPVYIVGARIPPILWPGPRCAIFVPAGLWGTLSAGERDALLAHELAHVRRRDHWVRPLELLVTALFWWNPVTWWARHRLRAAEEASCDALVVRALGRPARAYADALVKTLEFLARGSSPSVPALATGAGDLPRLKERLTMIVRKETAGPLSKRARVALLAVALGVLMTGPSWTAQVDAQPEAPEPPGEPRAHSAPEPAAVPEPLIAELAELGRQEMQLQRSIQELEAQRALLDIQMQEAQLRRQTMRMEQEIAHLEREGAAEEAEILRGELELQQRRLALHRAQVEAESRQRQVSLEREHHLRALDFQMQEADARARETGAEAAYREARRLEREVRRAQLEAMRAELELEAQRLEESDPE